MSVYKIQTEIEAAKRIVRAGNDALRQMANVLNGKLRSCDAWGSDLVALKKELQNFNAHTKEWKD